MDKKKYIFLDIDGVLNHEDFYCSLYCDEHGNIDVQKMAEWRKNNPYPLSEFDPVACGRVNEVIQKTGARLVVSSSWRIGDNGQLKNIFSKVGLPTDFDMTPILTHARIEEFCRGDEIKLFLESNPTDSYVILDDDEDMLPEQMKNFVHCDFMHGFTEKNKEQAIKILLNKNE